MPNFFIHRTCKSQRQQTTNNKQQTTTITITMQVAKYTVGRRKETETEKCENLQRILLELTITSTTATATATATNSKQIIYK